MANILTSIINIENFVLSAWNLESLDYVADIDFIEHTNDFPKENVHTEISDVAISTVLLTFTLIDKFLNDRNLEFCGSPCVCDKA